MTEFPTVPKWATSKNYIWHSNPESRPLCRTYFDKCVTRPKLDLAWSILKGDKQGDRELAQNQVKLYSNDAAKAAAGRIVQKLCDDYLVTNNADTIEDAMKIENDNPYGNAAAVFTTSGQIAKVVSEKASAGMIGVNIGVPVPRDPYSFGGWNESKYGHGDITGKSGVEFWTNLKKVTARWPESDEAWKKYFGQWGNRFREDHTAFGFDQPNSSRSKNHRH